MMEGWKEFELNNIIDRFIDYRGKTPVKRKSGVPLVTAKIVKNGRIQEPNEFISVDDYNNWMTRGFPKKNDIILTTEAPLGELAIITDEKIALAQRIITLRVKNDLTHHRFLKYLFESDYGQHLLYSRATGTTVLGIKSAELKKIKLKLPPLPTQRKIASILSAYDDLIENNLQRIKLLEEMAQQTYTEWFLRMKFPGHESVEWDEKSGLPKGWEKVKLGDVASFRYGKIPSKKLLEDTGYPIYSGYRITGYCKEYLFEEPTLIVVARGVGGTGDVKISPRKCWLTNLSIAIMPKTNILKNYLYYHLQDLNLRSLDSGAAQSQITINSLEGLNILNAEINIQHKFNRSIELIFDQIENLQNLNQHLKEARDILLPRLMMGMINVDKIEMVNYE